MFSYVIVKLIMLLTTVLVGVGNIMRTFLIIGFWILSLINTDITSGLPQVSILLRPAYEQIHDLHRYLGHAEKSDTI